MKASPAAAAAVADGGDHLPGREHGECIIHRLLVLCRSRLSILPNGCEAAHMVVA